MKTHFASHAETEDDLIGYFESCTTNPVFWCAVCRDVETLALDEVCADCRREAEALADAIEASTRCAACHGEMIDTAGYGDERCYWECAECGCPRQQTVYDAERVK